MKNVYNEILSKMVDKTGLPGNQSSSYQCSMAS